MKFLNNYLFAIDQYIKNQFKEDGLPGLYDPIRYGLNTFGKRIRPAMTLMGCNLYKENYKDALPAAFSVEIFHNFSLLHDDIMDSAELRRGQPSVYHKYGVPAAILAGDAMLIYSYKYLLQYTQPELSNKLIKVLSDNAIGVCEGQQMDMDYEKDNEVSIDLYLEMIAKKTSILLGAAVQMGGMIGGASDQSSFHLFEFGKNVGIAFQIQDDILDVFGNQSKTGKISGGDILNNKKTYLYLKALELGSNDQQTELRQFYSNKSYAPKDKIEKVKRIFQSLAVEEYANQLKQGYLDLGLSHLKAAGGHPSVIMKLNELSKFIIEREN